MTITADTEPGVDAGVDLGRRAVEALEWLTIVDIEGADRDRLDLVVAARRTVAAHLDSIDIRVVRRSRELAEDGRSEAPADVLRERGRRSSRDAAAATKREQACAEMPSFERALAEGEVSSGHVDALGSATNGLDEAEKEAFKRHEAVLLDDAKRVSVETFDKHCRDLARSVSAGDGADELARQRARNNVRRWVDRITGMHHIHAELDPETGAKVWTAINQRLRTISKEQRGAPGSDTTADGGSGDGARAGEVPNQPTGRLTYRQLEAQAFIDLVTGSGVLDPRLPEVLVIIDLDTLRHGLHAHSVCETSDGTPLPPSVVRRLSCQATIIPIVLGGDSEALDVGRAKRLATAAQRRAIFAMYSTCAWPGCHVPVDRCEIHHTDDWLHGGATDLGKLAPICVGHHQLIHDASWTLTIAPDRTITITRPDGTSYFTGTTTNRRAA
jgi:hypothetical protein